MIRTRLFLALLGVLGLLGCTRYIPYTSVYAIQFPPERSEWTAFTDCEAGGQPIILVNQELQLPQPMWKYVLIHEGQHAKDMRANGCVRMLERIQHEPELLLWLELRAYCSQFVAMRNDGLLVDVAWQYRGLFTSVRNKYAQHVPEDEFWQKIPCRPP